MDRYHTEKRPPLLSVMLYILGLLNLVFAFDVTAADKPLEKIRIAYSGISGSQTPLWVAHEKGFFRKYGLDVQLIYIEGASLCIQTLVSGDVTAAAVSGAAVIQSNLQGSGVVMTAGFLNTMDYELMVSSDITSPDQLRGKSLAVSGPGSSSDFATRYTVEKYGLVPDKDVAIVQIGSQPARFAALTSGKIQGAMVAIPITAKAKKMGFNELADLQMLGLEYPQNGLAVTRELIGSKPELVRNLTKAFVEAIAYFKTHQNKTLGIYQKYLKTDDMDALKETYEAVGLNLISEKPYPTIKGIQIVLRQLASKDPKAQGVKAEQFVDSTFLTELDKSGFIDRLYKPTQVVATRKQPRPVVPAVTAKSNAPVKNKTKVASIPAPEAETKPAAESTTSVPTTPVSAEIEVDKD